MSNSGDYYIITELGSYNKTDIIIPVEYNGLPVKEIGKGAFGQYSFISSVTLGKNISIIREKAFYYCKGLTEIYIPETVTLIELNAFYRYNNLTINCQAERLPSGFESGWNGGRPIIWCYLIVIPTPDAETVRVKTLLVEKYKMIDKIQQGNYIITCITKFQSGHIDKVVERKINEDYYYFPG